MALPILDGNQTAATLSTIITGGAHIPAHTVVSLGSQAISDIASGVSGSVVSISNFPSTQTIAGTVTANGRSDIYDSINDVYYNKSVIAWGNPFAGEPTLVEQSTPLPISGTVTANLGSPRFIYEDSEGQLGGKSVLIGTAGVEDGTVYAVSIDHPLPATIINSVTISSLPSISGTVTANLSADNLAAQSNTFISDNGGSSPNYAVNIGYESGGTFVSVKDYEPLPISGTVTVGAVPNGSLTTRFGTPTTANTAFATSAVTNASRKYLLVQNVTTGGNVITVGIGFTPTTTQGIQLTAGAGITFESSYIPTGAVMILSSVTASNFTVLEA